MLMTATMRGTEDAAEVAEAARWRAVLDRDRRGDGRFVFAVRTTGVYCRPSCPARRPRRENVAFFALPEAAEQAGFRSCRRCRPRDVGAADPRAAMVRRACRLLEDGERAEPWRLPELAEAVGVSARHLLRTFKDALGVTPREYAEARRLALFKGRLRKGDSVTGALYDVGFGSSSRLYEDAQGRLGMTPATYRRGGRGMRIGYTIADSPLGRLLVGATERGVAAVSLGDDDAVLETALRTEYPHAEITRDDTGLRTWVARVLAEVAGTERVAGAARHPPRPDTLVLRDRAPSGTTHRGARGGAGLREQSRRPRGALPPCGGGGRRAGRLSLGRGEEARAAGARAAGARGQDLVRAGKAKLIRRPVA